VKEKVEVAKKGWSCAHRRRASECCEGWRINLRCKNNTIKVVGGCAPHKQRERKTRDGCVTYLVLTQVCIHNLQAISWHAQDMYKKPDTINTAYLPRSSCVVQLSVTYEALLDQADYGGGSNLPSLAVYVLLHICKHSSNTLM
jgi:hypothetical protein